VFKKKISWGGAISASQTEGAYQIGNKGLSTEDIIPANAHCSVNQMSPQVIKDILSKESQLFFPKRKGINFYHQYKNDLELFQELGLKVFKTSIAWTRIFPNGDESEPNQDGLTFYRELFKECKKRGIKVWITISHLEMPLNLIINYGGWKNRKLVKFYLKFAMTVMKEFKNDVECWIPFHNINQISFPNLGIFENEPNYWQQIYQAQYYQLLATALTIEQGKKINKKALFGGSFKYNLDTFVPSTSIEQLQARITQNVCADLLIKGSLSPLAKTMLDKNEISIKRHTKDAKIFKNNPVDFVCLSYESQEVNPTKISERLKLFLINFYERYEKPIAILESSLRLVEKLPEDHEINDEKRISYLQNQMKAIAWVINQGVDINAVLVDPILDSLASYNEKINHSGLIYVDYHDQGIGTGVRYKKKSFYWYQKLITSNKISQ